MKRDCSDCKAVDGDPLVKLDARNHIGGPLSICIWESVLAVGGTTKSCFVCTADKVYRLSPKHARAMFLSAAAHLDV